jgi:hypothetical protein
MSTNNRLMVNLSITDFCSTKTLFLLWVNLLSCRCQLMQFAVRNYVDLYSCKKFLCDLIGIVVPC